MRFKARYWKLSLISECAFVGNSFSYHIIIFKVGRGNLILRHSVPNFPAIFSRHCGLTSGTQRRTIITTLKKYYYR